MFSAKRHVSPPMQLHRRAKVSGVQNCRRCCRITPRTAKPMGYAMNVRRGLFRLRSLFGLGDPLLWKADNLVQIAGMNAVTMFESLLKKFSFLREVDVKQWDFILTIAGVFIAVTRLVDLGLRGNRQRKLMRKVGAKLTQWNPTMVGVRLKIVRRSMRELLTSLQV